MADSVLREKSKQFAIDIIDVCRDMRNNRIEYSLVDQLLRSGTSIGANVHEAQFAQGKKDFISKFEIALKECNESLYWLDILLSTNSINADKAKYLIAKCDEIRKMLISSVTTLKAKS
ncbi:MAG: four helix bundle protein [Eubacteriales bacterium]|nr:four helix bundle protein [Eubacteriales bacterium]